jgi:hypothetical protein
MHANHPEAFDVAFKMRVTRRCIQNHRVIGKPYLLDFVLEISSRPIRHSLVYRYIRHEYARPGISCF